MEHLYTVETVYAPRLQLRIYRIISNNTNNDAPAFATTTVYVSQKHNLKGLHNHIHCLTNSCVFTNQSWFKPTEMCACVRCMRRHRSGAGWGSKSLAVYQISRSIYIRTLYLHCHFRTGRTQGPPVNLCIGPKLSQTGPSSHNSGYLF